ncbi:MULTISPECIES: PH domain-containing protein [Thermomonosporaceae]|uniref:PH domain-containing protein n=1 Tax=Thermomonosporaceae TaxID=2012 RepID=UPI00255A8AB0|nr:MULTISPECIES: PH domain-containing protein [Thermomonosporaceae]MDL4771613.1 PH domain-containing protein [Actinomadura xylanilytica]
MNMQDMMVFRDSGSRTVDKYLMSHEGRVIAVRRHPAVLMYPVAVVLGGLVLCGVAGVLVGLIWIWWLWLLTLGLLLWKVIAWSMEFFLVTEHRVMVISGVLNRDVAMMPLAKVTDIALERSVLGRMLGYGEFVMESAGQKQALRNVGFMPYPEQLYLEVSSVIFGAEEESPD